MGGQENEAGFIDTLWQPRSLVWLIASVLGLALVLSIAPGRVPVSLSARAAEFGIYAFCGLWIALLPLAAMYGLRARLARLDPARLAWLGLGLLLTGALLVSCASAFVAKEVLLIPVRAWEIVARTCAITFVVGLLSFGAFQNLWRNRQLRESARRAELAALQARTRPHFLFNTLNTAISLVRQRPGEAEDVLLNLSDLFRAALAGQQETTLAAELDLCRKYLEIESLRFHERLCVVWSLPEPLPDVRLPLLSLQPLVENAVLHGVERRPEGGQVAIGVRLDDGQIVVKVGNDLPPSGTPARAGHGIGLEAVRERLRQFTDGRGSVEIRNGPEQFEVELSIPLQP